MLRVLRYSYLSPSLQYSSALTQAATVSMARRSVDPRCHSFLPLRVFRKTMHRKVDEKLFMVKIVLKYSQAIPCAQ
jgi:hypothetical protein